MSPKIIYKNKLPHIAPVGATFFVTFRLADSLPQSIVRNLRSEMELSIQRLMNEKPSNYKLLIEEEKLKFFKKLDAQLDHKPYGDCYCKDPQVSDIVQSRLHELDKKFYELISYCVMPNHVHTLFDTSFQLVEASGLYKNDVPENQVQLHDIMRLIKGNTAFYINRYLRRKGKLWQKDSYDRFMRNESELYNTIDYIIHNPVKAGLAQNWEEYPYTYLHEDFL